MKYVLNSKQLNINILLEILQNRFTTFDNLITKWKYRDNFISCSEFENKIINTYNNKTQSPKNSDE